MPNRNQLRLLDDTQAAAITAQGNGIAVAEVTLIYWPSPDETTAYAWWNLYDDPIYHDAGGDTPLEDWLGSIPLVTAFVAEDADKVERFHEIAKTASFGDDVVQMRFQNRGQVFENLVADHPGGVKVEIGYFYPQVDGGKFVSWFTGHLRTPDNTDTDFVSITAVEGLRSADLLVPNSPHPVDCRFKARFGGRFDPVLPNNPCDYDRHVGGGQGNLDSNGDPFSSCDGSNQACDARGMLTRWGGFPIAISTSRIGLGDHTTVSETHSQTTRLKQPVQVPYGEGACASMPLLDYAPEFNPSEKHQDKGTIRGLFELGEGPIDEISEVEMMGRELPRTDGLGLETRLGDQGQAATTFSADVINYNRLAHIRGDVNPIDPTGVQSSQVTAKCRYKGRNTIRVYSDADTYTEQYTNLRAWVTLDALIDTTYGHREDPARHSIDDFIHWASKGYTFNTLMQGKSARQQFTDLCLSGMAFPPFVHDGITRWLCIEDYDLDDPDIPLFTATGANRNILRWPTDHPTKPGLSRLEVSKKDDDKIPNTLTLTWLDRDHKDLERPAIFPDEELQELAGLAYGDGSLREVPDQETAYGVTDLDHARKVGWYILDNGRFYSGGTKNNGEVVFVTSHLIHPEALDLHENKVIRIEDDKLDNLKDRDGNVFTHFIVKSLQTTRRGELIVTTQAFKALRVATCPLVTWTNVTRATQNSLGNLEKTTDSLSGLGCVTNASGTGDAGGRSVESITGDSDWEVKFSFNTSPLEGRGFGGLTTNSGFTNNYTGMRYCVHVSSANNTIDPHPPHSWFIYENGSFKFAEDGTYSPGDIFTIKSVAGTVKYYLNGVLKYTSLTAPTYPIYGAASLACLNKTIDNFQLCQNEGITGGQSTTQAVIDSRYVVIDRIWRDQELSAGTPGIYVAAGPIGAPTTTEVWPGFELYREIGSYSLLHETDEEAVIGEAISTLAGTTLGSETVDVELRLGQELPATGFVWLGGELFNYGAVTQLDTDPNQWRLSTLTNRGTRCTTAAMATHATGEDFALLDAANVLFIPLESSEIGETRDYKGITAGQDPDDFSADSLTFDAPNFAITTPADYSVAFDATLNQVVHTWTPLSDDCVSQTGLRYEIYADSSGSPGALLWSGAASEWRASVSASDTYDYHFRAKTNASTGAYVTDSITVTVIPGGDGGGERWEILLDGQGNIVYAGTEIVYVKASF